MKDVLLAPRAGLVIAGEQTLCTVPPTQQRREGAGRGVLPAGQCEYLLRQPAHHENQRIECMNPVRAEPGARAERWWRCEFRFVEDSLAHAPTGIAGTRAHGGERAVEAAIVARRGDPSGVQSRLHQLACLHV